MTSHSHSGVDWKKLEEPIEFSELEKELKETPGWRLSGNAIEKEFQFRDFSQAVEFINKVADVASEMNHHPDIQLWKLTHVKINITTYCTSRLSKLDLILASRIDDIKLKQVPK